MTFAFGGRHSIQLSYGCAGPVIRAFDRGPQTSAKLCRIRVSTDRWREFRQWPTQAKCDRARWQSHCPKLTIPAFISSVASVRPSKLATTARRTRAQSNAVGQVELDPRYALALRDLEHYSHIHLLYWMHQARRDLVQQVPAHLGHPRGTFALRSPVRPNPIALATVELVDIDGATLAVRSVDCVDGTPLVDIKPYFASVDSFPHARRP